jgi:hypothetical protein
VQYQVALLCRRLYSRHLAPEAPHLVERLKECADGAFNAEMDKLTNMKQEELAELYNNRDMEPR